MSEPAYRSPSCAIGLHADCADGEPRDSGVPGVRHLVCGCTCHPAPPARTGPPSEPGGGGWYRLCWTARRREPMVPGVAYGVLIGQDVPAMLRGMRGCLSPLAYHDPARVRALADTSSGWRYETPALTVHTHRIAARADWTPLFACPLRTGERG